MFPKPGKSFDPVRIPKAIKDAGFSVPEVAVTVDGTLVSAKQLLELEVPGLEHPFVLEGGAQSDALEKRADLAGKKIQVMGKLQLGHSSLPPRLTVEEFQLAP